MADVPVTSGKWRKTRIAMGVALFLCSWIVASHGIRWSTFFHPDELPVAHWINRVVKVGYEDERVYPGGWFELVRPFVWWQGVKAKNDRRQTDWLVQDGCVTAVNGQTYERRMEDATPRIATIQTGRDFNALLAACSSLLVYLAALAAGCHAAAAFFAGGLIAVQGASQ